MRGRKVCCTITLILLCLLIVNFFLPISSNGYDSIGFLDAFSEGVESETAFILIGSMIISASSLILGIIFCILCLCNVKNDYKYALASVPIPMIIYLFLFILFIYFANGGVHMSIGGILGPLLSIAALVLTFIGNAMGNKSNTNNYVYNTPNAPIKRYDPMTGKPIYVTFCGYDTKTGEPIYK